SARCPTYLPPSHLTTPQSSTAAHPQHRLRRTFGVFHFHPALNTINLLYSKQLLSFAALLLCNPLPGNFCIASPIRPITLLLPARPSVTTRHLSDSTQPTDPSRTRTLRTPATTPTPVPPCHNVIGEEQ
ncbi:hypothetical protein PoMZ_07214, partial [Pyricularia oryzae]